MERPTRIVLAVRVGHASQAPARKAAWLAERLGAELTLVYVSPELRTVAEVAVGAGIDEADVRAGMIRQATARARTWGDEALRGMPFDVVIEDGVVAKRIAAVAAELEADLIVAGSEAHGALHGMILGDTTRAILRCTPCPVVVVPPLPERD